MTTRCESTLYETGPRCIRRADHEGHHCASRNPGLTRRESRALTTFQRVWWPDRGQIPPGSAAVVPLTGLDPVLWHSDTPENASEPHREP